MNAPAALTAESLQADTVEADQWYGSDEALGPCWVAASGPRCRFGYSRIDLRIRGLAGKQKRLTSHCLAWLLDHLGPMSRDDLFLAYLELRESGLQVEHRCETTGCRRPSHLELLTQSENIMAGKTRAYARELAKGPIVHHEPDPEAVEF